MIPDELHVIALSAVPVFEYQLAIPLALTKYHFTPIAAYFLCAFGAILPFFPLYFGFEFVRDQLAKIFPGIVKPFDALIARADRKARGKYEKYGSLALFLALVVPFPLTGVWTMTLAAVAFKIHFRPAFLSIFLGMLCGAFLVMLASLGVIGFF